MVMMVVMAMRGKGRRRNREQERGDNNKLLHGKNVARSKFAGGRKNQPWRLETNVPRPQRPEIRTGVNYQEDDDFSSFSRPEPSALFF